ncbi:DUF5995 family protein [Flavobacterium pedocola]
MEIKQATTIEEVIVLLEEIIAQSKADQSPLGYFAALYHKVTIKVKEGIAAGIFQDGLRMEQLDVVFANRYLMAYYQYKQKESCSECWKFAFEKTQNYWPILLQHLLLGINAHINLDLGIAAAQICPGEEIHKLKTDFDKINEILASLVGGVENALSEVWPRLKMILRYTNGADTFLIDFSMQTARDGAWKYALELAPMDAEAKKLAIVGRDVKVRKIAQLVSNPGYIASGVFKLIRLFERGTVAEKIVLLEANT